MDLKVGSVVYATQQGLGILAKDFVDHGIVNHPAVVLHTSRPNLHREWYPEAPAIEMRRLNQHPEQGALLKYLSGCDVVLFFETPFDWGLIPHLRENGVKTILMPMYECTACPPPYQPDYVINPSMLDQQYWPKGVFINVPVPDAVRARYHRREKARVFVHNAGHGGLLGRNGTLEVLQAIRHVKSDAKFIIRSQDKRDWPPYPELLGRVTYIDHTVPDEELYAEGDVFLFPEKFNGLSLPLQEAYASGMLIMAADRFPMNTWLPHGPLVPVRDYKKTRLGGGCPEFEEAVINPADIARCIDAWYDQPLSDYSEGGYRWAESVSWDTLKPRYLSILKAAAKGEPIS